MSVMLHFIINPTAGNGKSLRVWKRIHPLLAQSGVPHAVHMTSSPGEAAAISRSLAESCLAREQGSPGTRDVIVVVSGDGTLREAANGLLDAAADSDTSARVRRSRSYRPVPATILRATTAFR